MTDLPNRIWVQAHHNGAVGECWHNATTVQPEKMWEYNEYILATPAAMHSASEPYQIRVHKWILACFGAEIGADKTERNHRFLEESLELVQSLGCSQSEAHQLVDYVFSRDTGEPAQEVGGVMNTLAALCTAADLDMVNCGEVELDRVWTKVETIRAKQASKPKHSPLPQKVTQSASDVDQAGYDRGLREAENIAIGHCPAIPHDGPSDEIQGVEYATAGLIISDIRALMTKETGE